MVDSTRQLTEVGGLRLEDAGGDAVRIAPAALRSLVNLRGRPDEAHFATAVREVVGLALPEAPNRWNGDGQTAIIWLGPDEWLIMAPDGEAPNIESRLRQADGDDPWLSVVDVTHNYTGFTLSGPAARDVLAKGCPLDLHPRSFGPGDCAQTLLAQTRALLRATDAETIEIWLRNSFARYTASWLLDSMAEFTDFK